MAETLDALERIEKLTKGVLALQVQAAVDAPKAEVSRLVAAAQQGGGDAPAVASRERRNAVIGLATDISFDLLYRFVRSLRESTPGSSTDLVLFTNADSTGDYGWLFEFYKVQVHTFQVDQLPAEYRGYHPSSYRWILIRDWMKALPPASAYDVVLLTDVRDTRFQGDPFAHVTEPGFYAFQEARPATIASCGWNAGWVRDCFGDVALQRVGTNIISCSGTSMATWAEAVAYVDLLADELLRTTCERNGVDQGMHNFFVYGGALKDAVTPERLHVISNEDGWIASVQSMHLVQRNRAGYVMNARNTPYAMVHQYDRSPALMEQYAAEFVWLPEHDLQRK